MTMLARLGNHPHSLVADMQARWRVLLGIGVGLLALGLFGLYASTLLAKAMTGAMAGLLILAGVLQLSQSLLLRGLPSFAMTVALGAAQVAGGIAIWTHPQWAALAVAITVAVVLLVQAVAQILFGIGLGNRDGRWVSIGAGGVALLAAVAALAGVRWGDRTAPSWSMAIALLSMGVAYVAMALIHRHRGSTPVVPAA